MGLNIRHVAFGALVVAAVALPFRRRDATAPSTASSDFRYPRLNAMSTARREAHYSWTAFALRDSAVSALANISGATTTPVVTHVGYDRAPTTTEDSLVATMWHNIGQPALPMRTAVVKYRYGKYQGQSYIGTMISQRDGRTDCAAIIPEFTSPDGDTRVSQFELRDALAPCALLAAFGTPGQGVAEWLESTRFLAAHSGAWLFPDTSVNRSRAGPWIGWSDNGDTRGLYEAVPAWVNRIGATQIALLMSPPYEYGAVGLRCLAGAEDACVTGVLHSSIALPDTTHMPAELTLTDLYSSKPGNVTLATVRPPIWGLTSEMIDEFGRDRFRKFWTSDHDFETAFRDAFGESLGHWTARWARHRWQRSESWRSSHDVLLGVTVRPSSFPATMAWSGMAVLVAVGVARRRTA